MTKLTMDFVPPSRFGPVEARIDRIGTAVSATVALREAQLMNGQLMHLAEDHGDGCTMQSRFHLGGLRSTMPLLGPTISWGANRVIVRRRALSDALGLALLRHYCEEMHHLAAILPEPHVRFGTD